MTSLPLTTTLTGVSSMGEWSMGSVLDFGEMRRHRFPVEVCGEMDGGNGRLELEERTGVMEVTLVWSGEERAATLLVVATWLAAAWLTAALLALATNSSVWASVSLSGSLLKFADRMEASNGSPTAGD